MCGIAGPLPAGDGSAAPIGPLARAMADRLGYDALLCEVGGRVYAAEDGVSRGRPPAARHPLLSSSLVRRWECPER